MEKRRISAHFGSESAAEQTLGSEQRFNAEQWRAVGGRTFKVEAAEKGKRPEGLQGLGSFEPVSPGVELLQARTEGGDARQGAKEVEGHEELGQSGETEDGKCPEAVRG